MERKEERTQHFIETINKLIENRKARNRREIVEQLGWNETALSNVMAGRRPVPEQMYEALLKLYKTEKQGADDAAPVDSANKQIMWVPLVNKYAYAGYTSGWGDPEYIERLPTLPFPADKEYKGTYIAFEVKGDSMDNDSANCLKEGDIVLCRELTRDHWKNKLHYKRWSKFVIVSREGILIKQIIAHDLDKGTITAHSLNDMYKDFVINLKDVSQLFNVVQVLRSE